MKVLTISAHYPPKHSGGYGIRIKNIMDGLSDRGHEVFILTTRSGKHISEEQNEAHYPIFRVLHDHYGIKSFPKEVAKDIIDVNRIDRMIQRFHPDLIYLGHIYPLTKQLLPFLSSLNIPVMCDEGGNSLKGAWTDHGRWYRFTGDYQPRFRWMNQLKPFVVRIVGFLSEGRIRKNWTWPKNLSVIFNSHKNQFNVQSLGVQIERSQVIHSGIDTLIFTFRERDKLNIPINIICPGRIEPRKWQLDAVRLMASLKNQGIPAHLVLVGEVFSSEYRQQLLEEIKHSNLTDTVTLLPMVSQEELVTLYHQADICFFPSHQEPGLSRIPLEAMACGCVVISYGNEGSGEIITNRDNGFLVASGAVEQVAQLIDSLGTSPTQLHEVFLRARHDVIEKYSLQGYIGKVEGFVMQVLEERN